MKLKTKMKFAFNGAPSNMPLANPGRPLFLSLDRRN